MRKVNDLYGKQVINQSTGEKVAAVRDVVLSDDARRIVALVVGDGMWANGERVIRWDSIISVGDFVIAQGTAPYAAVADDAEVGELRKQANKITGTMVVTSAGERLGTIGDMFFGNRGDIIGYSIKQGMMGGSEDPFLPADQVQVVGKDAVIATTGELTTMKNVDLTDDVPQEPLSDELRGPATRDLRDSVTRDLREQSAGQWREPMPDIDVPRAPRAPLPDDRGVD
jgi:uncharacterized protein YrrD